MLKQQESVWSTTAELTLTVPTYMEDLQQNRISILSSSVTETLPPAQCDSEGGDKVNETEGTEANFISKIYWKDCQIQQTPS
ncbi:hypothetical protein AVEN_230831-1 [Araneus ventricosus]|uniref:Uncharacterized protein n=1 Tax=Araneus ventricosus TaxID=182803 RepID=A0A4Y2A3E2_ARAVE|nr:hypothetical protein AVEN_230831-1 [Araneus ventricosus]